ncbi:hypothetical protein ACEPAG_2153 [Sanghuangporus baumii]
MVSQFAGIVPASQINSTFGCLFLAGIFSSVLWGIGCLQLYLYYEKYWKTDRRWLKVYVCLTWLTDTGHQVLLVVYIYGVFVKGILDPTNYIFFPKAAINTGILAPIVDTMVQMIFVRRAWYLSKRNIILTGILLAAVVGQFVMNVVYYGLIFNTTQLFELSKYLNVELALNCVIAFTDTLLAAVLICLLWRSRSGFQRTDSLINRLVAYTIGSSFVTSIWMVMAVIGASIAPHSLIYALADLTLPKLYFNCMLASLNARSSLRGIYSNDEGESTSIRFEDLSATSAGRTNLSVDDSHKTTRSRVIECRVDIDVDSNTDQRKVGIDYPSSYSDPGTTKP